MKTGIFVICMLITGVVYAQNPTLTYRSQDPFLFCEQGQDVTRKPDRCWWPLPPYTGGGAWMTNPICEPVDPEGKPWDSDDWASWYQYESVCPLGVAPGSWESKGGDKATVPFKH